MPLYPSAEGLRNIVLRIHGFRLRDVFICRSGKRHMASEKGLGMSELKSGFEVLDLAGSCFGWSFYGGLRFAFSLC